MGASVIAAAEVGTLSLALFAFLAIALAVARFAGLGFVFGGEAERLGFLHQALYGVQLADHGGGIDGLIELERAAEIEPFDDLRKIDALEVLVVDLADGGADQIAGHGIAAFELALVF